MSDAFARVVGALVSRGWSEAARSGRVTTWSKGSAITVVPEDLAEGTLAWRQVLAGIMSADPVAGELLQRSNGGAQPRPASSDVDRFEWQVHLTGPGLTGEHETGAYELGRFVAATATAVNELAKDSIGARRRARALQIVGGPIEGSVFVRLREPHQDAPTQERLFEMESATPEGTALQTLSQICNVATQAAVEPSQSILTAQLELQHGARASIGRLARVMIDGRWEARGHLVTPKRGPQPFELSLAGAHRLDLVARERSEKVSVRSYTGKLDAWKWSHAELEMLVEEGDRRAVRAAVPAALQLDVAALLLDPEQRCTDGAP